jgi:antitoxin VapB
MKTAKIFTNGRSQAVRLPKAFRFSGEEVYIKKTPSGVLLMAKEDVSWDKWEDTLRQYQEPFMTDRRQPAQEEWREPLD